MDNRVRGARQVELSGLPATELSGEAMFARRYLLSEPSPAWDVVAKVAVEAADETEARTIVDVLLAKMRVVPTGALVFGRLADGAWAAEMHIDSRGFEQVEPNDPLSVLSCMTAQLEPVTWKSETDTPFDPESASAGMMEWPPGYWALAGRKETLGQPLVRAVYLRAQRSRAS